METGFEVFGDDLARHRDQHMRVNHRAQQLSVVEQSVIAIDPSGTIIFWNDVAQRLFGWSRDDMLGRDITAAVSLPNESLAADAIVELLRASDRWSGELLFACKNRTAVLAHVTTFGVRDDAGELLGIIGVAPDYSSRVHFDASLHEGESRYRSAFEDAPNGMAILSQDGVYRQVNAALCRMLDVREEDLIGRAGSDFLHEDDREQALEYFRLAAPSVESPAQMSMRFVDRSERVRWGLVSVSSVHETEHADAHLMVHVIDLMEQKTLEERLRHQAYYSALTGLPNRALLLERAGQTVGRSREPACFTLLLIDIDDFREINDSLGHDAGDVMLIMAGYRLQECVRKEDTVAHIGGDQFAVLISEALQQSDLDAVIQRIERVVSAPMRLHGRDMIVTVSIGVAVADDTLDPAGALRRAEIALHHAKRAGKNRVVAFTEMMHSAIVERLDLVNSLRHAIMKQEFTLHYQTTQSLETGQTTGAEALVRWQHRTEGLISPARFIPLAEETGLIVPIGRQVLRAACRQMAIWNAGRSLDRRLRVSVNIAARQLLQPDLVDEVISVVSESGLLPQSLVLEITESAFLHEAEACIARMRELKQLGVMIAIDDFGTGYSSLSYLKHLPADFLKIDRSFVAGLGVASEDTAIVAAIVTLARELGMVTVAEGVETAEQATILRSIGCNQAQGYFFARPVPASEIALGDPDQRDSSPSVVDLYRRSA